MWCLLSRSSPGLGKGTGGLSQSWKVPNLPQCSPRRPVLGEEDIVIWCRGCDIGPNNPLSGAMIPSLLGSRKYRGASSFQMAYRVGWLCVGRWV